MAVYTVDYGHALVGSIGARGCGYLEEVETRKIGRLVTKKLRSLGHVVHEIYLDNAVDMRTDLNYRVNKINSIKPDLSISIHLNAFANASANGTEVWADKYCWNIAQKIVNEISSLGYTNRGVKDGTDTLALVGLYGGSTPALLVECAFITNSSDMSKYNIEKMATAIVKGVTGKTVGTNTTTSSAPAPNTTTSTEMYRIRKTWVDTSSQKGAYTNLDSAKDNCPSGYYVFNSKGVVVYPITSTTKTNIKEEIKVDYIIQYSNSTDQAIAEVMADRLNCPTINCLRPYAHYSQYKTVIAVGEAKNKSGYTNVEIKGGNRAETLEKAIAYCKKLGK